MVHVFATSLRTGDFELIQCNCSSIFPGTGERGHSPRRSGIDVGGVNQAFGNRCAMTTSPYAMAMQPSYQYPPVYYQIPPYTPTAAYSYPVIHMQAAAAPMPTYSRNATGLRVNVGHGAVITEHRGIFIQGLDYKATSNEIKSLLYEVGLNPVEAKVHKDHSGKSKGVGTAKFGRKEDAERGVQMLNGKKHWGKTLKVRLDTESTVVGELKEPFIVDGTNRSASGVSAGTSLMSGVTNSCSSEQRGAQKLSGLCRIA